MQERAPGAGRGGLVEIGVLEHDERGVAAEFEVHALEVLACQRADLAARGGRSGERDHADARVGHERLADVRAARKHVQQPLGQPGLLEHPRQHDAAADRGARIGLEHDRIAERERRAPPTGSPGSAGS